MAKVINFGLIYGMSAFVWRKISASSVVWLRITLRNTLPDIRGSSLYAADAFGCACSRLCADSFRSSPVVAGYSESRPAVRAGAERAAINAPMQGTAADLIKRAMISLDRWLKKQNLKSRLILQVHDELILEVPEDELELVKENVAAIMQSAASLSVPLLAEVGVADNWEAAH